MKSNVTYCSYSDTWDFADIARWLFYIALAFIGISF